MAAAAQTNQRPPSVRSVSMDSVRAAHRCPPSAATADHHQSDGPRPVRNLPADPKAKRVAVPKKAKAARPRRTIGAIAKDNCAKCGLAYSTVAATAITEPVAVVAGVASGLAGATCGLISCEPPRETARHFEASGLWGVKYASRPASWLALAPCIGKPSIRRLERSEILSKKTANGMRTYIRPHKFARDKLREDGRYYEEE